MAAQQAVGNRYQHQQKGEERQEAVISQQGSLVAGPVFAVLLHNGVNKGQRTVALLELIQLFNQFFHLLHSYQSTHFVKKITAGLEHKLNNRLVNKKGGSHVKRRSRRINGRLREMGRQAR